MSEVSAGEDSGCKRFFLITRVVVGRERKCFSSDGGSVNVFPEEKNTVCGDVRVTAAATLRMTPKTQNV